jgi:hypothetical protein
MKTKLLLLSLLCFLVSGISAQDETPPKKWHFQHEFGFNASTMVEKLLKLKQDSATANPYLIKYRISTGKVGLHVSLGGFLHNENDSEDGFADTETLENWRLNARLGVDYRFDLGKRLNGGVGLDGILQSQKNEKIVDSGFDVIRTLRQSKGFGVGPSINLYFMVTSRLSIGTETGYYFLFSKTQSGRLFSNFPELNDSINRKTNTDFTTLLPTAIFISYRF